MKKRIGLVLLAAVFTASMLSGCMKVVKTGEEASLTGAVAFNAGDDVAKFWDSTAVPEMQEKAIELGELLKTANGDLTACAGEEFAKYSMGDQGELTYTVKAKGSIAEVEKTKKAGYITVKLDDYDGAEVIKIQIGTVFKGTTVRDSLNFINFNDYTNQIEWAEVSQSINSIIQTNVIDPIGYDAFEVGKAIEFTGAVTIKGNDELLITPTKLSIQ